MSQLIAIESLTEEQARSWLIANDQEAAEFWRNWKEGGLVEAVRDNLKDFGTDSQSGPFTVTMGAA